MDGMYDAMAALESWEQDEQEVSWEQTESPINYHNITKEDMNNGDGLRVVLWVAGCSHQCPQCQNPQTWNPDNGLPFDEWAQAELWEALNKPWIKGLTFSGGDPLHCANRTYIGELAKQVKERLPEKDIWCYTGYQLSYEDEIFTLTDKLGNAFTYPALSNIDVLCDGPFEYLTRESDLNSEKFVPWVGSSNQRIIDVKETISTGRIIERKYDKSGRYILI